MRCPFLREAQVKFCCASEFKKLIVRGPSEALPAGSRANEERCSSPVYVSCPSMKQHIEELPSQDRCPFLQESLCQYCAAASIVKYVPYSDPVLTRCGTSSHRYCDLLLTMQNPGLLTPHDIIAPEIDREDEDENGYWIIDGIQTVGWLSYSPNHMWADYDEDGTFHIGIDAFLAKVLGNVDRLAFAPTTGEHNPSVCLTVNGVDLQMMFPRQLTVTSTNSHLRADPRSVVSDPYTLGWLFEGKWTNASARPEKLPEDAHRSADQGLIRGKVAKTWMQEETRRLTEFVSNRISHEESTYDIKSKRLMADGGMFTEHFMNYLSKEEILILYDEFFSMHIDGFTTT